jgi:hypothetical protein
MGMAAIFGQHKMQLRENNPDEFDQFVREAHRVVDFLIAAALLPRAIAGNKQHVKETGQISIVADLTLAAILWEVARSPA